MCSVFGLCDLMKMWMVLATLVCAISLSVTAPVKKKTYVDDKVQRYLMQFGYLPLSDLETGNLRTEESIRDAVRDLQRFGGLEPTGEIDEATRQLLTRKRCGLPDKDDDSEYGSKTRFKRYTLQGQKWQYTNLTWSLRTKNPWRLDTNRIRAVLARALDVWAQHSKLTFQELDSDDADILVSFQRRDHGDGYAFDGKGQILAHAFFPNSGRGGDAHFDEEEIWLTEDDDDTEDGTSFFLVAAHEFGHSLGLSHSGVEGALMFPWYEGLKPNFELPEDDRHGIQQMYGSKETRLWAKNPVYPMPYPTRPPRTTERPTWSYYPRKSDYPDKTPYKPYNPDKPKTKDPYHPRKNPHGHFPPDRRIPDRRYPEKDPERYPERKHPDREHERRNHPHSNSPNHPDTRYPDPRHPDARHPERYPERRHPDIRHDGRVTERYPDTRYPDPRYPDPRYPDPRYPDIKQPDRTPERTPERVPERTTERPIRYPSTRRPIEVPVVPDTCDTSYDAISVIRREVFIFKDAYLWRVGDKGLYENYPAKIIRLWPGLPTNLTHVDAVYERLDNKIVFFIGKYYYVHNGNYVEHGFPKPLTDLGLPASLEKMDAAMVWGHNAKTYFYSGTVYWRFDETLGRVELDYPRDMSMWKGVGYNIDTLFQWKDGKTYFFKGKGFWKFNDLRMRVENEHQTLSAPFWMGCPRPLEGPNPRSKQKLLGVPMSSGHHQFHIPNIFSLTFTIFIISRFWTLIT